MKSIVLALSLVSSGVALAADQNPYTFVEVPHSEIDQHLVIGSDATGTPAPLQGLWWMDGNPLNDEVMSFANTHFEDIKVFGRTVGHQGTLVVYDQGIWSWHDTEAGRKNFDLARKTRLTYHVYFNVDYTYGVITPIVRSLEIPVSPLAAFTMTTVNADEYSRDTKIFGRNNHYRFRRIVDGRGQRLPNFDAFLKQMEVENLPQALLPICSVDSSTAQLPTACAAL